MSLFLDRLQEGSAQGAGNAQSNPPTSSKVSSRQAIAGRYSNLQVSHSIQASKNTTTGGLAGASEALAASDLPGHANAQYRGGSNHNTITQRNTGASRSSSRQQLSRNNLKLQEGGALTSKDGVSKISCDYSAVNLIGYNLYEIAQVIIKDRDQMK